MVFRFVAFACSVALISAQSCLVVLNGNTYDFRSLQGQSFNATGFYNYLFTPCENGCSSPQIPAMICQNSGNSAVAPVSLFDTTLQWSMATIPEGVEFVTNNGGPPNCSPSNKPRFATMLFVCDKSGDQSVLTVVNEPNLQGCNVSPGYSFQLNTILACAGATPPPSCFTPQNPCVIQTYNIYAWTGGTTLIFNQYETPYCGSAIFSDYLVTKPPPDTCPVVNGTAHIVAHIDINMYSFVMTILKSATDSNPAVIFWDPDTGGAVIGLENPANDSEIFSSKK